MQKDYAFECASEELKTDKKFMKEVVMHRGYGLEYASEELKADKKFIVEADKYKAYAFEYASEDLKVDEEFMVEVDMRKMLGYTSEELEADSGVYTSTLRRSWCRRRRPSSGSVVSVDMRRYRGKTKKLSGEHRAVWPYILVFLAAVWWRAPHFELEADTTSVEETTKPNGGMQECTSEELEAEEGAMTEDVNLKGRPRDPD